jgi:hypothetical protein
LALLLELEANLLELEVPLEWAVGEDTAVWEANLLELEVPLEWAVGEDMAVWEASLAKWK